MADAVRLAPYDQLAEACAYLVNNDLERTALASRGFSRISARDERAFLVAALGMT
jgi:hypothetical protein